MQPAAIVTDIEGTTSSIAFVKDVLFPYAARSMEGFLSRHWDEAAVQEQITALASETDTTVDSPAAVNRVLQQWISEDRKATPLKTLQGMIWRAGYENGDYQAHVYPDAVQQLNRWHDQGIPLYVYSSGSIAAQKLFFAYSEAGDLTPLFAGYFDTTTGAKQDSDSYQRIAENIGQPPAQILFLSDIEAELNAAQQAGMQTVLLDRENVLHDSRHKKVASFAEITF